MTETQNHQRQVPHRVFALLTVLLVASFGGGYAGGLVLGGRAAPQDVASAAPPSIVTSRSGPVTATALPVSPPQVPGGSVEGGRGWRLTPKAGTGLVVPLKTYDLTRYVGCAINDVGFATDKVAITFDDGPSAATPEVLDVLARYRARATFFFVGQRIVGNEAKARSVLSQGSEIGNHTYRHTELLNLTPYMTSLEIVSTQDEILHATGEHCQFLRARSGRYNADAMAECRRLGLVMVDWDAQGGDTAAGGNKAPRIASSVLDSVHGGSIIMLHETNPETVRALPTILETLERRGYRVVTLSELLSSRP